MLFEVTLSNLLNGSVTLFDEELQDIIDALAARIADVRDPERKQRLEALTIKLVRGSDG